MSISRSAALVARVILLAAISLSLAFQAAEAQEPPTTEGQPAQPAQAVVPQTTRFTGQIPGRAGDTVEMVFSIYAGAEGGEPLWTEMQSVSVGGDGKYTVLLGSASQDGLPASVFANGQARWIGVTVERGEEQLRTPLTSVAYAMKAADSESVGGLRALDLVTQSQFKSQLGAVAQSLAAQAAAVTPFATPTGSGTANYLPLWSSASALGNSIVYQSGATKVGIGTETPATTLDVNGAATVRGSVNLLGIAATATAGANSPALDLSASAYSSTSHAAVAQNFAWQARSSGNNTASPTANLDLMFGAGTTAPAATGLSIAPNGQITFASGQKFPGVGGAISGVTAGTGLTGGGTSGNVTLNVDTTKVPLLSTVNNYSAAGNFTANVNLLGLGGAITATNTNTSGGSGLVASGYAGVAATGLGTGVSATATGASGTGVNATASGTSGTGVKATGGKYGVLAISATGSGVFGQTNGGSATAGSYNGYAAGVWGDSAANTAGIMGTSGLGWAGLFVNNSPTVAAVQVTALGTSEAGVFYANSASDPAIYASNSLGTGITASGAGTGLQATDSSGTGIGVNGTSLHVGVQGNTTNGIAVYGTATGGTGVYGSSAGVGVLGESTGMNVAGVYGTASTYGLQGNANSYGVYGTGTASTGIGVYGTAPNYGVEGVTTKSDKGVGVYGSGGYGMQAVGTQYGLYSQVQNNSDVVAVAGTYGIWGKPSATGQGTITVPISCGLACTLNVTYVHQAGVWADTGVDTAQGVSPPQALLATADNFTAATIVNNSNPPAGVPMPALVVGNLGGGPGENAVPVMMATGRGGTCTMSSHGDTACTGQLKALVSATTADGPRQVETYSVQSTENWFEDAGTAQMVNGVGRVDLEPVFGQTVNTGIEYHVFLTPDGDCKGLYVASKTATGFEVRELGGGKSSIAFEYRIMAKRIGHETERLVDVTERNNKMRAAFNRGNSEAAK